MRRPPPSLGFSWTLNLNYKVLLGLTFFFSHIVSLNILSLSSCLFICTCISFLFLFCLVATHCYHSINSATLLCHNTLLLSLYLVACPTLMLHLIVAPPYYYCKFHLVVAMNSTLLLLQAPLWNSYEFHLATCFTLLLLLHLVAIALPLLPFYLPFYLVAYPPLLFLYLL